jgi:hypothetical protein
MSRNEKRRASRRQAREDMYRETSERYKALLDDEAVPAEEPSEDPEDVAVTDPDDLGWRTSRRTSRVGKEARRAKKRDERVTATKDAAAGAAAQAAEAAATGGRFAWRVMRAVGITVGGVAATVVVLLLLALAINGIARWNAERQAAEEPTPQELAQDNLLVIGADENEVTGFLAMRVDEAEGGVFGIAVPAAAFMEVPGQGFERAGDSFKDGPEVSAAAISNFLSVIFDQFVVVDGESYQRALEEQSLEGLLERVRDTNMTTAEVGRFAGIFDGVTDDEVALVPLPVKPIALGDETYFEPQREEVADLLFSWWGVNMASDKDVVRVIVYNGSGVPGIAGTAAQELISQGFRVVETRNAEDFDYEETLVILYRGEEVDAERVRDALGVGEIVRQEASQDVADVIVIIGQDYEPPAEDG